MERIRGARERLAEHGPTASRSDGDFGRILDDCEWPSVATASRYFEVNAGWTPASDGLPGRLRALRLPDPRVEPRFEDFKPFET